MTRNLGSARKEKNDEFYTQLKDIENELRHYRDYFKNKVVYCNADDPRVSNFFHYFSYNFESLGLKKLITTCYKNQEMDLFSMYDQERAITLIYEGEKDNGKVPKVENIGVIGLKGDGDFRSPESIGFLEEADIVVTNPPFSLFREYVGQLVEYDKDFIIIGNFNSVTYKEIFPLIKDDKMWLGYNWVTEFAIPKDAPDKSGQREDEKGNRYQKFGNVSWFTNIDNKRRHENIVLYKRYNSDEYPTYDNFEAIEVSKVTEIPKDYFGIMGVPITFLSKHNPEQFKIIGFGAGELGVSVGVGANFTEADHTKYRKANKAYRKGIPCYTDEEGNINVPYARIFIQRKDKTL